MSKIFLRKEGPFIFIFKEGQSENLRYSLIDKRMEKLYKDDWVVVNKQYKFFRGYSVKDIESNEPKFTKLIELSKKYNDNCSSVSTFIARLKDVFVYENFIINDIEFSVSRRYWTRRGEKQYDHLIFGPEEYSKTAVNFFKETKFIITKDFEKKYFDDNNCEFVDKILLNIMNLDIDKDEKKKVLDDIFYVVDELKTLINEYNYNMKSLINFVVNYLKPFENIAYHQSIRTLKDYYSMAFRIGRKVKKYPKYLNSMHDIITANYNSYKQTYDEELFKKIQKPELLYETKDFCIMIPLTTKDIISEGTSLNHCVASYVDKILNKKTYIFFLRKTETKEDSLVTLELKENKIIQARGSYNRTLTKEEKEFLEKYSEKKQLILEVTT